MVKGLYDIDIGESMSATPSTTQGLTTAEAQAKLQQYGRNEMKCPVNSGQFRLQRLPV